MRSTDHCVSLLQVTDGRDSPRPQIAQRTANNCSQPVRAPQGTEGGIELLWAIVSAGDQRFTSTTTSNTRPWRSSTDGSLLAAGIVVQVTECKCSAAQLSLKGSSRHEQTSINYRQHRHCFLCVWLLGDFCKESCWGWQWRWLLHEVRGVYHLVQSGSLHHACCDFLKNLVKAVRVTEEQYVSKYFSCVAGRVLWSERRVENVFSKKQSTTLVD